MKEKLLRLTKFMNSLQGFLEGGLRDNGYNNETSTMFSGGCQNQ